MSVIDGDLFKCKKFVIPYKKTVIICLLLFFFNVMVDLFYTFKIRSLVVAALDSDEKRLVSLIILLCFIISVGIIVKYISVYTAGVLSKKIVRDIRHDYFQNIYHLKMFYFEKNYGSEVITRFNSGITSIEMFLEKNLREIFYQPVLFLSCLVWLVIIDWKLLLVNIILVIVITIITGGIITSMERKNQEILSLETKESSIFQDIVNGILVIKTFALYPIISKKVHIIEREKLKNAIAVEKNIAVLVELQMIMTMLAFSTCSVYGGVLAAKGNFKIENLIIFLFLLQFMLKSMSSFPKLLGEIKTFFLTTDSVTETFNWEKERIHDITSQDSGLEKNQAAIPVQFKNVTFGYDAEVNILQDISFEIPGQKMTAIIGQSGNGKSTLLKLVSGLHEPNSGSVLLNGIDLKDWDLGKARNLISIIPQKICLFSMSIAQNISCGKPGYTMDDIINAAASANAHEFIEKLPEGYHTLIGSGGIQLSAGQAQRLALARALCKDSPIILLDEPTSSIDMKSEKLINEALKNICKDKTVILVAHRTSTLANADNILVLEGRRITKIKTQ
ncbi:ABC transporter ATP-binding protein [Robinsoniella sp.]|uniref:ABC transporter ATP-binding protein n=1 Tax=Robinsoniella sp. TaxID=2496533 RepID=UPI003751D4FD